MKTKILMFGIAFSLLTVGCSKSDTTDNSPVTTTDVGATSKMDIADDDIANIVEGQFNTTMANGSTGRMANEASANPNLPNCVTITRNPAFGTAPTVGQLVTKTLDFGNSDCALPNGNILKGKIIITFVYDPSLLTHSINYSFVDFYHNDIMISGNKTFTRTMTSGTDSHPLTTMEMDMTATFPDGKIYHRTGERVREMIAGFDTVNDLTDDEFQVTGTWTTIFPNGTHYISTITTPLLIKLSCAGTSILTVQGVITYTKNNHTAILDYGDGTCDDKATLTIGGVAIPILLGN